MKKMIIGIIIGLTLGMATNAFAAIGDKIEATFGSFMFKVDGQEKTSGADPLVYQGSAYLPVRDIANMLGFDVTYKSDTRTIEFNGPEPSIVPTITPASSGDAMTLEESPTPSGTIEPTPTPNPSAEPTPTTNNTVTEPTPTPAPTVEPTPAPAPDNAAACQAIRDDYNGRILMLDYQGLNMGPLLLARLQLGHERDQALSAAGC